MEIKPVAHPDFVKYGHVIEGYDFTQMIETLNRVSEKPADEVIYVPGDKDLEALPVAVELRDRFYGGMPLEIGYCNGTNRTMNCLEYHRGCELNIAADDVILLLAPKQKIVDGKLDTAEVEAFLLPAGQAVVLYETSLHYAPCSAKEGDGFRVVIVLPMHTNTDKPAITAVSEEDKMLWARNKWLLAHPDAPEAGKGAYVGLTGTNITL